MCVCLCVYVCVLGALLTALSVGRRRKSVTTETISSPYYDEHPSPRELDAHPPVPDVTEVHSSYSLLRDYRRYPTETIGEWLVWIQSLKFNTC